MAGLEAEPLSGAGAGQQRAGNAHLAGQPDIRENLGPQFGPWAGPYGVPRGDC